MSLGKQIQELREKAQMTQSALAALAGTDRTAIKRIETNKQRPNALQLERIASAFNIEPDALVNNADEGQTHPVTRISQALAEQCELLRERSEKTKDNGELVAMTEAMGRLAYNLKESLCCPIEYPDSQ